VGSHQWATELGNKLTMMATKDTQSATLHMSPADLGPVQVRIDMNQNQASVWFTAEHADTRSALEQSLPRLREMFASQGMSLTDAGVFNGQPRQQANYSSPEQGSSSALRFAGDEASETISSARGISLSLLDAYA
jgi:flagellar hook-length control protein FliK